MNQIAKRKNSEAGIHHGLSGCAARRNERTARRNEGDAQDGAEPPGNAAYP
ncbi:MAG: hypothetical protein IJU76_08760 [Desulfovibrionaceae bacterium]|nr:hypothetical protein [Desulfovibrionaceae bacterium]